MKVEISLPDKTLIELVSKTYSEIQLQEIVNFEGSINELNTQYPIECIRNNEVGYRVSFLGNGRIVIIYFDDYGNKLYGNVYNIQRIMSDFSGLAKGQSLTEVRELDPNGDFLFLYTGRNDTPKMSTHYTTDGYMIKIHYDNSHNITRIESELI